VYVGHSASAAPLQKRKTVDSATGRFVGGVREAPERLRKVSWHGGARYPAVARAAIAAFCEG
jgi:hypothetical protein